MKCIEDEIPFDLPEGWSWCRLRVLFNVCSAKRVRQADWKQEGIPFYRAREIVKLSDNGYVENELFISKKHYSRVKEDYGVPQSGDLMVSGVGTIGKIYVVKGTDRFYYKDASVLCFENRTGFVMPEFARILLESSFIQTQMKDNSKGTTVDTITISAAMNYLCILPPIKEQSHIVQAVQNAFIYTEEIQKNKISLQTLIAKTKSQILDLAIRGQLVPQDPTDEPASVLLERIRTEKEELIRQGKIKRDKKDSVIFRGEDNSYYEKMGNKVEKIDDEILFDLPSGWAWCRFSEVIELFSGQDLTPDKYSDISQGIPYITGASNLENGCVTVNRWTSSATTHATIGDLLLIVKGSGVGKMAICDIEDAHIARKIMALRCRNGIRQEYLRIVVSAFLTEITAQANGIIPGIRREVVLGTLFPLPPSSEQLKISAKANCIIAKLQMIEKSLS